ncbi:MAG TPA: hypothetical protein DEP35_06565 [Deltaproteobacteria bacterium]|jgi:hypothetical protein|nr:hypothetical protein [Deltaproteobacteria bacterium]
MGDSTIFDLVSDELEQRSSLSRLEARGTVRLALKEAGLDAATVTVEQMTVVLRKVLPRELKTRNVGDPAGLCEALAGRLSGLKLDSKIGQTPEAVFARLAPS